MEPKIFIKPFSDSIDKAVDKLDFLLSEVIEGQINADVEVGTFLSGGIDSSLITSIAQKVSKKEISSFSIGFEDSKFDESIYAEKIAKHLGTNHRTKIMSKDDINNIFDTIIDTYGGLILILTNSNYLIIPIFFSIFKSSFNW